jgi:hypothetical protein
MTKLQILKPPFSVNNGNKFTRKICVILASLALTGCAISPEAQGLLSDGFSILSNAANTGVQAQEVEQQQLMRYHNQALQDNADRQKAYQLQQLCMNPANRKEPLCLRPQ